MSNGINPFCIVINLSRNYPAFFIYVQSNVFCFDNLPATSEIFFHLVSAKQRDYAILRSRHPLCFLWFILKSIQFDFWHTKSKDSDRRLL